MVYKLNHNCFCQEENWDLKFTFPPKTLSLGNPKFFTQTCIFFAHSWSSKSYEQESSSGLVNWARIRATEAHEHEDGFLKLKWIEVVSAAVSCIKLQSKVEEEDLETLEAWAYEFGSLQVQVGEIRFSHFSNLLPWMCRSLDAEHADIICFKNGWIMS